MKKLPVISLLFASLVKTWENRTAYLMALALPTLLLACVTFSEALIQDPSATILWSIKLFLGMPAYVIFVITCHRLILLDTPDEPFRIYFGSRELKFIVISFILSLLFAVVGAVFAGITILFAGETKNLESLGYLFYLISIPSYYLLARCSLVFPAIAVGDALEIQDSWRLTRGNGLGMFFIVAVYPVITETIGQVFYLFGDNAFTYLLANLIWFAGLALGIFALSYAYRYLVSEQPQPDAV